MLNLFLPRVIHAGLTGCFATLQESASEPQLLFVWQRNVVVVGGVSFWADFLFVERPGQPASYPGIVEDFARTFRVLQSLPCDIFLGAHGSYSNLKSKLTRLAGEGPKLFLDSAGYKEFSAKGQAALETALKKEQEAAGARPSTE